MHFNLRQFNLKTISGIQTFVYPVVNFQINWISIYIIFTLNTKLK